MSFAYAQGEVHERKGMRQMGLSEVRNEIDRIDSEIKELLMKRMDCSYHVAEAKQAEGSTEIYRADRENAILENLGTDVAPEKKAEYLAVVRKVMETSRMYQYGLLYDWNEALFDSIVGSILAKGKSKKVRVYLTRYNQPNAMSSILSMIGDYGYNMEHMRLFKENKEENEVSFELIILGDVSETHMRKLLFQLSKESKDFSIEEVYA